jgi:hypothetical protein
MLLIKLGLLLIVRYILKRKTSLQVFNPLKSLPNECNRIYRTPDKNSTPYGIQSVSMKFKQLNSKRVPFYLYHPVYKIKHT